VSITRRVFEVRDPGEGYIEDDARNTDAPDVRGVYIQNDSSNDSNVVVSRDASNNMTLTDPNAGTVILQNIIAYNQFLLDNEPIAETGTVDAAYTTTITSGKVTKETWKRNDTTNVKTIDYTYSGSKVATEVRKVFAADGTTVVAQVTWTYTYTGSTVSSASMTRDV
jgi:hypothetical protein